MPCCPPGPEPSTRRWPTSTSSSCSHLRPAGSRCWHAAPRPERRLVFTTAAALFVVPLLLWGTARFHQPVVPFFAIAAALALDRATE